MKRLLVLLCFTAIGCSGSKVTVSSVDTHIINVGGVNIREFEHGGHKYLTSYDGGLIHSESCPCKGK